ncbi:hypothetical protein MT325_m456L [Paramecium bursaria chlorella virus MT325]|uniref:Uncharacterized protein m456L n=1 Tax=Paramecium bursaria Chlorella virus MT325 TaxID=346932 RepID=A7IUI6_PBCVM|nr:hypothetical protein MT325_m456L [Paramecium bursaria chlorella virus MT325]
MGNVKKRKEFMLIGTVACSIAFYVLIGSGIKIHRVIPTKRLQKRPWFQFPHHALVKGIELVVFHYEHHRFCYRGLPTALRCYFLGMLERHRAHALAEKNCHHQSRKPAYLTPLNWRIDHRALLGSVLYIHT